MTYGRSSLVCPRYFHHPSPLYGAEVGNVERRVVDLEARLVESLDGVVAVFPSLSTVHKPPQVETE